MDQITRMRCFLKVADHKGFSAAAREMGRSKALVSKYIGELEDELGVRLLNRTTRQVSLTEVGQAYYKEASEILQPLDEFQVSVQSSQQAVRGRLRISAPRSMGDHLFNQAVMEFLAANPDVTVDLRLEDRFVDLVEEGFDLAIRVAELEDSSLIARQIAPFRTVVCATPQILEKYGRPTVPADLATRPCLIDTNYRYKQNWAFQQNGERRVRTGCPETPLSIPLMASLPWMLIWVWAAGLHHRRVSSHQTRHRTVQQKCECRTQRRQRCASGRRFHRE